MDVVDLNWTPNEKKAFKWMLIGFLSAIISITISMYVIIDTIIKELK